MRTAPGGNGNQPRAEEPRKGAGYPGHRRLPAEPRGRAAVRSPQAAAQRPAGERCDRAGCRPRALHIQRGDPGELRRRRRGGDNDRQATEWNDRELPAFLQKADHQVLGSSERGLLMAQRRMISRNLGSSRKFHAVNAKCGKLGDFAQALFPLIVVNADDFGRLEGMRSRSSTRSFRCRLGPRRISRPCSRQ